MSKFKHDHFRSLMPENTIFVDPTHKQFSLPAETKAVRTCNGNVIGLSPRGVVKIIEEECDYSELAEDEILIVPAHIARNKTLGSETQIAGALEVNHLKGEPVENLFRIIRAHQRSSTLKIWPIN